MPLISARFQLAVAIEPEGMVVALWRNIGFGWQLHKSVRLDPPKGEGAETPWAPLRAQLTQWSVPKGAAAVVVPPNDIGGFLDLPMPRRAPADTSAWIEAELGGLLPFSAREVAWSWRVVRAGRARSATVVWMPKAWVKEVEIELARAGVVLREIMPRALVAARCGDVRMASDVAWAVCETGDKETALHVFRGHRPQRTLAWRAADAADGMARALAELRTLWVGTGAIRKIYARGVNDALRTRLAAVPGVEIVGDTLRREFHDALLMSWRRGDEGVWLPQERGEWFRGLRRATFLVLSLGVTLVGLTVWQNRETQKQIATLETDIKKDKPKYQKVQATEARLVAALRKLDLIGRVRDARNPLDALEGVEKALPAGAWVTRLEVRGDDLTVEGRGADNATLLKHLGAEPGFRDGRTAEAGGEADRFAVRVVWQGPPTTAAK